MKKTILYSTTLANLLFSAYTPSTNKVVQISSTEHQKWVKNMCIEGDIDSKELIINIDPNKTKQTIEGFGACFNELGWNSLSRLSDAEKASVMKELFAPNYGANFQICRMPLGANDFSIDWYSYNETHEDFEMENFSIDNDKKTLIPFIKSAKKYNPELKIWASPWAPPSWMKYNKHYAMRYNGDDKNLRNRNGLALQGQGKEGVDMFIQEPKYFEAYALYFSKFINAYRQQGIDIFGVMPQNEFNSDQIFPSCCWTASSLANFVGNYLGPQMEKDGVDVMFGTMERPNAKLVDTVLNHPTASKYIKAIGFQWAGKHALPTIHKNYPNMKLYQTEQECGDGVNGWYGVESSWQLMKHYLDHGVSAYMYWNISLDQGGISRWGWAQNSLVVVDPVENSYKFTNEYYLLKHLSHFVGAGSKYICLDDGSPALALLRPDGKIVVMLVEMEGKNRKVTLKYNGNSSTVSIAKNSINTIVL